MRMKNEEINLFFRKLNVLKFVFSDLIVIYKSPSLLELLRRNMNL
jgi:hypothetical protein